MDPPASGHGRSRRQPSAASVYELRTAAARERIPDVLWKRGVTYRRELERHVCEVGFDFRRTPSHRRPEPYEFSLAIADLVKRRQVRQTSVRLLGTPHVFWWRADLPEELREEGFARKRQALEVMMRATRDATVSGYHAEELMYKALLQSSGRRWFALPWKPGHQIDELEGRRLDPDRGNADIDLAGWHVRTGIRFVAQVKNKREWQYPSNAELWSLLGAAAQLEAFPIFIARRFAESTFGFMKSVGGFALRTSKTIYPERARDLTPLPGGPTFLQALTTLGFRSDTDFTDDPLPRHIALWEGSINREIAGAYQRFLDVIPRVLELAYEEGLADNDADVADRPGLQSAFYQELLAFRREQAIEAAAEAAEAAGDARQEEEWEP